VRREHAKWIGLDVHEKLEVDGAIGRLAGHLLHCPFTSVTDHLQNTIKYARLSADSLASAGEDFRWYHLFSPWISFLKILLLKGGWRDGWRGWVIAGAKWVNVFAKYAFLLERRWSQVNRGSHP
jgi:hypothetical protein